MKTPDEILRDLAKLFEEKNKEHGDSFLIVGKLLELCFPNGITLKTAQDHNKYAGLVQVMYKVKRITTSLFSQEHLKFESWLDSPHDLAVYSAMLAYIMNLELSERVTNERLAY